MVVCLSPGWDHKVCMPPHVLPHAQRATVVATSGAMGTSAARSKPTPRRRERSVTCIHQALLAAREPPVNEMKLIPNPLARPPSLSTTGALYMQLRKHARDRRSTHAGTSMGVRARPHNMHTHTHSNDEEREKYKKAKMNYIEKEPSVSPE